LESGLRIGLSASPDQPVQNCTLLCSIKWDNYIMTIKLDDWVEHAMFGVGQVSALRGDKLDIAFLNSGDKTLMISAPLAPASLPAGTDRIAIGRRRKIALRVKAVVK
jgi:hypothetical protein